MAAFGRNLKFSSRAKVTVSLQQAHWNRSEIQFSENSEIARGTRLTSVLVRLCHICDESPEGESYQSRMTEISRP